MYPRRVLTFWVLKCNSSLKAPTSTHFVLCLGISKSLDPIAGQLSNTIATKITAVEGTLKESITKLVKSKVRRTRL